MPPRAKPRPIGTLLEGVRFQLACYDTPRTGTVVSHSPAGTSVRYDPYMTVYEEEEVQVPGSRASELISSGTSVRPVR